VVAALLLLVALLVYHRRLEAPLTSDARFLAYENAHVIAPDGIWRFWTEDYFAGALSSLPYTSGYYRPLVNSTFWLEYRWAGTRDFFYNTSEVLLHVLNGFLVALLVGALLRDRMVGAVAGLIFVIHPLHAFAASEPAARADVLFASFYLGALIVFQRALERPPERPPGLLLLGVAALSLLSVLSKEMGITVPAALCLLALLAHVRDGAPLQRLAWTAPAWIACAAYAVWRFGILDIGTSSMGYGEAHSTAALVLATVKTLPIHLSRMFLPLWPSYPELNPYLVSYVSRPFSDPLTYVAIALVVGLCAAALGWRQRPLATFWIAFFLVSLSPLLKVDDIGGTLDTDVILAQERWVYLPSVAVFALLAQGAVTVARRILARGIPAQRVAAAGLALVVLLALGISSAVHAGRHEDPFALLRSLYLIPDERLGRMQHANRLLLYANLVALPMGDLEDAEARVRQAVELVPDSPLVGLNVARVLAERGKWEEALAVLSPWLAPTPAELEAHHRTNFRVYDDVNRTAPEIPVLLARAEAHLSRGEAALELLCEGERRGAPASAIDGARREVNALLDPAVVAAAPPCTR
jgi:tetratricopeptide (TPR) repeat protein